MGAFRKRHRHSMSRAFVLAAIVLSVPLLSLVVLADESFDGDRVRTTIGRKLGQYNGGSQSLAPPQNPSAGGEIVPKPVSWQSFTREFLEAHNKFRAPFQLPPLTWDKSLTRYARRWGMKRAADCRMIHSYGPYGESLFWAKMKHWTPKKVVESWANENKNYDLNSNSCADGQMCGHYTQIIWKETTRLGCARINCLNGELLVICQYDPPGNYVNEKPI